MSDVFMLIVGLIGGFCLGAIACSRTTIDFIDPTKLIEECQKDLPRTQTCVLVAQPNQD